MIKFDLGQLSEVDARLFSVVSEIRKEWSVGVNTVGFTTSPALSQVAAQYTSYLSGHPGSLAVASRAAIENVSWVSEHLSKLISVLEDQEQYAVDSFTGDIKLVGSPDAGMVWMLPSRTEVPVLDLAYVSPIAAIEATTPLPVLTKMFAGSDGGIVAAAQSWATASTRMQQASDTLQRAAGILEQTTEGTSFEFASQAIRDVSVQCSTVSVNAQAMSVSMNQLPPIRAAAHAQLIALEAKMAAEATAAGAATGGTGAAAVAAQSQAEVVTFVSTYLQPALDTARPTVANLSMPVVGHTGGGTGVVGATNTMPMGEVATQVAGGATAPGPGATAGQAVSQATAPAGAATAPAGTGVPAGAAPTLGRMSPTGGAPTAGVAPAGVGRTATPTVTAPAGTAGATTAPGTSAAPGVGARGGAVSAPPGGAITVPRGGPGASMGTGTGSGASAPGRVVQPLLPKSFPITGGPVAPGGPGGAGNAGGNGSGNTGARGTAAMGPMMGGAGRGAGAGTAAAGGASQSGKLGNGTGIGSRSGSGFAGVREYFTRQFLGKKPQTVKKTIR